MADKRIMTPEEKALLQARHRQEEAEARNRKKERDALFSGFLLRLLPGGVLPVKVLFLPVS